MCDRRIEIGMRIYQYVEIKIHNAYGNHNNWRCGVDDFPKWELTRHLMCVRVSSISHTHTNTPDNVVLSILKWPKFIQDEIIYA